jgi:hypothetical protein
VKISEELECAFGVVVVGKILMSKIQRNFISECEKY